MSSNPTDARERRYWVERNGFGDGRGSDERYGGGRSGQRSRRADSYVPSNGGLSGGRRGSGTALRDRSRSPENLRREAMTRQREALRRRPTYPGSQNQYADPFMANSIGDVGQDVLSRPEFTPALPGSAEARTRVNLTNQLLTTQQLSPGDIPGQYIRNLDKPRLEQLAINQNIIGAHIHAALHVQKYGKVDREAVIDRNQEQPMGKVGNGPVQEHLFDWSTGIDSLDRTSSKRGAGITKDRYIILTRTRKGWLQVVTATAFGGSDGNGRGQPAADFMEEYAHFLEAQESARHTPRGMGVLRYAHVPLTKDTFIRYSLPQWIPEDTPITWYGNITVDSYSTLADLMELSESHPLRQEGRRQKQRLEDEQKIHERKEKQEREMREILEREEKKKAEKAATLKANDEALGKCLENFQCGPATDFTVEAEMARVAEEASQTQGTVRQEDAGETRRAEAEERRVIEERRAEWEEMGESTTLFTHCQPRLSTSLPLLAFTSA